jgi:hypothetical protein
MMCPITHKDTAISGEFLTKGLELRAIPGLHAMRHAISTHMSHKTVHLLEPYEFHSLRVIMPGNATVRLGR